MILHLYVSNSVHRGGGVCLSACWDTPTTWQVHPPGQIHTPAGTPLLSRHTLLQVHPPVDTPPGWYPLAGTPGQVPSGRYTPWQVHPPRRSLQRTVRILLECFLVVTVTMQMGERKMYYLQVDHSQNVGQVQGRMRKPSDRHVFVQV